MSTPSGKTGLAIVIVGLALASPFHKSKWYWNSHDPAMPPRIDIPRPTPRLRNSSSVASGSPAVKMLLKKVFAYIALAA
jgi:hypothetical protein